MRLQALGVLGFVITLSFCHQTDQNGNSTSPFLWGPYRPNVYFGMRPRVADSLFMGLMWSKVNTSQNQFEHLRHTCEQYGSVTQYGWQSYDVRSGGTEMIHDAGNNLDLQIDYTKDSQGDSWDVIVRGRLAEDAAYDQSTTIVMYVARESDEGSLGCLHGLEGASAAVCAGYDPVIGSYELGMLLTENSYTTAPARLVIKSLDVPKEDVWKAQDNFQSSLAPGQAMVANDPGKGNFQLVQLTLSGDFDIHIKFQPSAHKSTRHESDEIESPEEETVMFNDLFDLVYEPQPPFADDERRNLSKSLLANLMGGVGLFHGNVLVQPEKNAQNFAGSPSSVEERGPYSLLTAVPSRSVFPRGFLWDEGFHLMVIIDWDLDFAVEIVTGWLSLMDENGWIAREQVLGAETRSRVPPEYQTQIAEHANPPTLFIAVDMIYKRMLGLVRYHGHKSVYTSDSRPGRLSAEARTWLENTYRKLEKHYLWFRRTQSGELGKYQYLAIKGQKLTEGYRWRGREDQHNLPSGMDDYPRAEPASKDDLHLDALCWVSLMARTLSRLQATLSAEGATSVATLDDHHKAAVETANQVHWSETDRAFCDVTFSELSRQRQYVCHKGYLSLLPFLLMDQDDQIDSALDLISDPSHLWSQYGIRSLSLQDSYYGKDENYWRSPIWINMNYLILLRLYQVAQSGNEHNERAGEMYRDLRRNIVDTVYHSWKDTGTAWEHYNPDTGKGEGAPNFTGWTSLVVTIIAMPELVKHEEPPTSIDTPNDEHAEQPVEAPNEDHAAIPVSYFDVDQAGLILASGFSFGMLSLFVVVFKSFQRPKTTR